MHASEYEQIAHLLNGIKSRIKDRAIADGLVTRQDLDARRSQGSGLLTGEGVVVPFVGCGWAVTNLEQTRLSQGLEDITRRVMIFGEPWMADPEDEVSLADVKDQMVLESLVGSRTLEGEIFTAFAPVLPTRNGLGCQVMINIEDPENDVEVTLGKYKDGTIDLGVGFPGGLSCEAKGVPVASLCKDQYNLARLYLSLIGFDRGLALSDTRVDPAAIKFL